MAAFSRQRHQKGFTLLEVLIVVAVVGLSLSIATFYNPTRGRGLVWHTAVDQVGRSLHVARSKAIVGNRAVRLTLDLEAKRVTIGDEVLVALPPDLAINVTTVDEEGAGRRFASIRFNRDGSASGGRIELADGQRKAVLNIDWLTGRITVRRL